MCTSYVSSATWLISSKYASKTEIRWHYLITEWVYEVFSEHPAPTYLWCRKPNNVVLTQSHAMAKHHKSKPHRIHQLDVYRSKQHIVSCEEKRGFNTSKQYSREMQGSYRAMGVWKFTFIGFNMTHCLLAKTEHQQEIDSKNKDQAPSAFPHILYILPWHWHSHRGVVHKEPVRKLPQSEKKAELCMSSTGWSHWHTHKKVLGADFANTRISEVYLRI